MAGRLRTPELSFEPLSFWISSPAAALPGSRSPARRGPDGSSTAPRGLWQWPQAERDATSRFHWDGALGEAALGGGVRA